jgi:tRNA G10  N-methylase Trm11
MTSLGRRVTKSVTANYYFKLDPNIRNPKEVQFGKMEIEGLAGQIAEPVQHFYDVIKKPPVSYFDNADVRIQDFLLNLRTVYGGIQGYHFSGEIRELTPFIERLAYTREIYVCAPLKDDLRKLTKLVFPHGAESKNFQSWTSSFMGERYFLFRIITNIFFLEQMNNVMLCSAGMTLERQKERMSQNIEKLVNHIMKNIRTYIPKFPKDANWKEFEDFVDEPKEITLYLTHFYGPPYKAKFHPRMIRALLNFANVNEKNVTGDFMLGAGTFAIESALLNVRSKGSDINPLTEVVAKAKIDALRFKPDELLEQIDDFIDGLRENKESQPVEIAPYALQYFRKRRKFAGEALLLNRRIKEIVPKEYQDFFRCALARVVSTASKTRREVGIFPLMEAELRRMWKVVFCLNKLTFLHVPMATADIETDDVRDLKWIGANSADLIITSPPYSTAINYVSNDLSQLLLLELISDPMELEEKMMGSQRKTPDLDTLSKHITETSPLIAEEKNRFHKIPREAQEYILDLKRDGNLKNALRCYKFLYDMWDALKSMQTVLRSGGTCILIIGNNMFRVGNERREFRNGDFLEEMALRREIGFSKWHDKIVREYSKSSYGTILKEDIIFLKKDHLE